MVFSAALILRIVGVYLSTGGTFGVYVMLAVTVFGMFLNALNYAVVVVTIGFFRGLRFELSLGQTATILRGDLTNLVNHPVAIVLSAMSVLCVYYLGFRGNQSRKFIEDL